MTSLFEATLMDESINSAEIPSSSTLLDPDLFTFALFTPLLLTYLRYALKGYCVSPKHKFPLYNKTN
jgi:hypothetical protein